MKKQFFLFVLMIFSGVFFTSMKKNGVKACGTNTVSSVIINKCKDVKEEKVYIEDVDVSVNIFMNPFVQL